MNQDIQEFAKSLIEQLEDCSQSEYPLSWS